MPADEVEHRAIENVGLLPINRMAGLRRDDEFAPWNLGDQHAADRRRRREIGSAVDDEGWRLELLELRLRHLVLGPLAVIAADMRLVLELDPLPHALGIHRPVRWSEFAEFRRQVVPAL